MAFAAKREGIKQVPWFSLAEWHQVYKQIYSNDIVEQTMAYETLLAWKARMPKLPVGVDCTLSIIQVCLRDREWTPKIDTGELPISYENDLCLMYSTTIMRFLNHISNIGHTKQTSLFQIAKQLNIPEWIVNLRHDTAHGHELPSIGVLRIAINILLTWLHEEYWVAEAKALEAYHANNIAVCEAQEMEDIQAFKDLMELWTAVSLYIYADYYLVSDIPDLELRDTLQELRSFAINLSKERNKEIDNDKDDYTPVPTDELKRDKKYTLETAQIVLLSEISRYLGRKSILNKEEIVFDVLFNIGIFLPNTDNLPIFAQRETSESDLRNDVLPLNMFMFWENIIFLLHDRGMLEILIFKLLEVVNNQEENRQRRLFASLWISSICHCYVKLDAAQRISQTLEYKFENAEKKLSLNNLELKRTEELDRTYPHLKHIPCMDISNTVPTCFTDMNFVSKLLLNVNEFSAKFIPPILELVTPAIDKEHKQLLLNLVHIRIGDPISKENNISDELFTVEDFHKQQDQQTIDIENNENIIEKAMPYILADQTVRNIQWKITSENYNWAGCTIGILPWQVDSLEFLTPLRVSLNKCETSTLDSEIIPGIIDLKELKMQSQINWNDVLREKRRLKRKHEKTNTNIMTKRALETIKKRK